MRKYLHGIIRQMAEKFAKARYGTMLKLMWVDGKPMWIPVTEQEDAESAMFAEAVRSIPEIKPEQIADNAGYIGKHAENVSVYDAMLAEIYAERNKAKARRVRKPDNRTHAERIDDWNAEKERRKWHRFDRDWELYNRDWKARSDEMSHAERKIRYAESIARADWELEQDSIAEDRDYAELEEEYREWERRYRHEKYMRNLNEWLKYA